MARGAERREVIGGQVLRSGVLCGPVVTLLCLILTAEPACAVGTGEGSLAGCPMLVMQGVFQHVHPPSLATGPELPSADRFTIYALLLSTMRYAGGSHMATQRPKQMVVRLTEREHEEFRRAAQLAGLPFSDWVRRRLTDAADQVMRDHSGQGGEGPPT